MHLVAGLSRGKVGNRVWVSLGLEGTEKQWFALISWVWLEAITDLISSGFIFEMAPCGPVQILNHFSDIFHKLKTYIKIKKGIQPSILCDS